PVSRIGSWGGIPRYVAMPGKRSAAAGRGGQDQPTLWDTALRYAGAKTSPVGADDGGRRRAVSSAPGPDSPSSSVTPRSSWPAPSWSSGTATRERGSERSGEIVDRRTAPDPW